MKKIPLNQVLAVSLGFAILASSVNAASPTQNLLLLPMKLSPGTNATSIPKPPRPKIGDAVVPGTQACVPSPPLPKRVPGAAPATTPSKC